MVLIYNPCFYEPKMNRDCEKVLLFTKHLVILPNNKTRCDMDLMDKKTYQAKADVLKALAHPTRLWMVESLAQGERCVCEFVEAGGADFSTISKHLSVLKNAGIVSDDKRGKQVYYQLKVPCVLNFMNCVMAVLQSRANEGAMLLEISESSKV